MCSDDTVTEDWTQPGDLPCPASTDPADAAAWLVRTHGRIRLVMATHISADRVAVALRQTRLRAALVVIDEAHWSAGRADERLAIVHDEHAFPADRCLYATATPKVVLTPTTATGRDAAEVIETASMDDEQIYGPTLYDYPAARAIAKGYVNDSQVGVRRRDAIAVMGNLPATTAPRHETGTDVDTGPALPRAVTQTALTRAAA